ncbi:hypothetical protein Ae201684P_005282 [Aphanomyces euteiches]|uniref:Uncharacterized protein n=1 Tax=Aphanomyces euteiches TaxID=100861 RepID=A0A6G0X1C3_9STRA|nr:hypothetical protein Ae201684_009523 [Aphanomyces euteiches]KAH9085576.1 hypothetical protein Ae201684P_005282 [Aphanomyces euteiches]
MCLGYSTMVIDDQDSLSSTIPYFASRCPFSCYLAREVRRADSTMRLASFRTAHLVRDLDAAPWSCLPIQPPVVSRSSAIRCLISVFVAQFWQFPNLRSFDVPATSSTLLTNQASSSHFAVSSLELCVAAAWFPLHELQVILGRRASFCGLSAGSSF